MEEGKVDVNEICVLLGIKAANTNEVKNVIETCKSESLLKAISDVLKNMNISYEQKNNHEQDADRKFEMLNNFIEEAGIEMVTDVGFKDKETKSGMFMVLNSEKMVPLGKVMYTPKLNNNNTNWFNE